MVDPARVLVATLLDDKPDRASVAFGYHQAMIGARNAGVVTVQAEITYPWDVVRTRSTVVSWALRSTTPWDWILWWDSDVVPQDVSIIGRMHAIAEEHGYDWIGCPYPRKRLPAIMPYVPLKMGENAAENDCIEVRYLAIGLTFTKRSALERMVDAYREELWFTDTSTPDLAEAVGIFDLVYDETRDVQGRRYRDLLSEDYSACCRHRALGGRIMMYAGDGAPAGHVGAHLFTGTREDLGRVR